MHTGAVRRGLSCWASVLPDLGNEGTLVVKTMLTRFALAEGCAEDVAPLLCALSRCTGFACHKRAPSR
jgi:hypothetical protein